MEKYEALFRTINDKISECEKTIEYYRESASVKDETIRELRGENKLLKEKLDELNALRSE